MPGLVVSNLHSEEQVPCSEKLFMEGRSARTAVSNTAEKQNSLSLIAILLPGQSLENKSCPCLFCLEISSLTLQHLQDKTQALLLMAERALDNFLPLWQAYPAAASDCEDYEYWPCGAPLLCRKALVSLVHSLKRSGPTDVVSFLVVFQPSA